MATELSECNCEIDIIWNNGFRRILTAAGEKALNRSSFIVELYRYRYLLILWVKDSSCFIGGFFVMTTLFCVFLAGLKRFEMLGIAAKYDIKNLYFFP